VSRVCAKAAATLLCVTVTAWLPRLKLKLSPAPSGVVTVTVTLTRCGVGATPQSAVTSTLAVPMVPVRLADRLQERGPTVWLTV
jgi:hypothetical protein